MASVKAGWPRPWQAMAVHIQMLMVPAGLKAAKAGQKNDQRTGPKPTKQSKNQQFVKSYLTGASGDLNISDGNLHVLEQWPETSNDGLKFLAEHD